MTKKYNRKKSIRTESQLQALKAPVCQEIVDALGSAGPVTVAGLGELLARPADSLYPHLRKLLRVGLVIESGQYKEGRHVAAVYDLPVKPLKIDYTVLGRSPTLLKVVGAAVRLGLRDYENALQDDAVNLDAQVQQARGGRVKGWLNARELRELNSLLNRAEKILQSGTPGGNRKAYSLGYVMAPADRRREDR